MPTERLTAPKKEITTIWNKNFICVMIVNTLQCFGHFAGNPLVASYTKYLGTSDQMSGFLAGMFFGVAFAIRPISGPMITKLDKRMLMILTFVCGCVANLGYALFESVSAFAVFRFINGLEYSFLGTLIMTLASDNLPLEKMGSGMGIYSIGAAVGTAVAPTIGSALLDYGIRVRGEGFGFALVFLYSAAILALAIIPSAIISPDRKTKEEIAGAGAWYKNILTVHAIPIAIVILMIQIAYSLFGTYIIEFGKEKEIAGISIFFMALAVVLVVSRPMSGVLTDKLGPKKVILPGMAIFALSYLVVGSSASLLVALAGAAIAAIGFGSSQPPLIAMSMQTVEPIKRGVASNTIYLGTDLGLFLGPLLGGFVHGKFGYAVMFKTAVIPVGLGLIAFIISLPIYKRRRAELGGG